MHCVGDASSRAPPGGACSRPASRPPHELGGKDSNSGQCDVHVVHRAAVRAMSRQALIAQVGHGEELEEEAVDVLVHTAGIPYSCVALKRGPEEDEDWFCLECRTAGKGPPDTRPGNAAHTVLSFPRRVNVAGGRRCGAGCGATRRRPGACRRGAGQRLRHGARPGPPRWRGSAVRASPGGTPSPMMPADGRACERDRPGRPTADGVLFAGDEECTWLRLMYPTSSPN